MEIESHHLATNSVLVDSGRIHQWVMKLEGGGLMMNRILTWSQGIQPQNVLSKCTKNLADTNNWSPWFTSLVVEQVSTAGFLSRCTKKRAARLLRSSCHESVAWSSHETRDPGWGASSGTYRTKGLYSFGFRNSPRLEETKGIWQLSAMCAPGSDRKNRHCWDSW